MYNNNNNNSHSQPEHIQWYSYSSNHIIYHTLTIVCPDSKERNVHIDIPLIYEATKKYNKNRDFCVNKRLYEYYLQLAAESCAWLTFSAGWISMIIIIEPNNLMLILTRWQYPYTFICIQSNHYINLFQILATGRFWEQ